MAQPESYTIPSAGNMACNQKVGAGAGDCIQADDNNGTKAPKYDFLQTWRASAVPKRIAQSTFVLDNDVSVDRPHM